jgi:hypothetical protein
VNLIAMTDHHHRIYVGTIASGDDRSGAAAAVIVASDQGQFQQRLGMLRIQDASGGCPRSDTKTDKPTMTMTTWDGDE